MLISCALFVFLRFRGVFGFSHPVLQVPDADFVGGFRAVPSGEADDGGPEGIIPEVPPFGGRAPVEGDKVPVEAAEGLITHLFGDFGDGEVRASQQVAAFHHPDLVQIGQRIGSQLLLEFPPEMRRTHVAQLRQVFLREVVHVPPVHVFQRRGEPGKEEWGGTRLLLLRGINPEKAEEKRFAGAVGDGLIARGFPRRFRKDAFRHALRPGIIP